MSPAFTQSQTETETTATQTHNLEDIELQTTYSPSIDFSEWKITDNKAVNIKLSVISNPSNKTILVEHMHADIFIESTNSAFDGITQDSMDDKIHGSDYPGFLVSEDYSYYETFSIEGASPSFMESVSVHWTDWYTQSDTAEYKFSEDTLINKFDDVTLCGI